MASDEQEPSLPRLPAVSWDEHTQSFSNNPRKRGRVPRRKSGASVVSTNSSDPAVFSSDDDPALDNYHVEGGRRKKRYVGSWFQQQPAASSSDSTFGGCGEASLPPQPRPRRTLARKLDSGVYVGSSDGGTSSDECDDVVPDFFFRDLAMPARPKLPQLERAVRAAASSRPTLSPAERRLRDVIRSSIESGNETVDFMSMDLEALSNDTVSPLTQLACIPQVSKDVEFEQRDPELKLYLAQNHLSRLPGALFRVDCLTTLSLRGNRLDEVPPAIGQLSNLQELNLSQNRLRHLPVELLGLLSADCRLRSLIVHPNPFLRPNQGDEIFEILEDGDPVASYDDYDLDMDPEPVVYAHPPEVPPEQLPRMMTRRLGRSPLQTSDSSGRVLSRFRLPSQPTPEPVEVETVFKKRLISYGGVPDGADQQDEAMDDQGPQQQQSSRVPSLVEAVMRSCSKSDLLSDLRGMIPEELSGLGQLLDRAVSQRDSGGLGCSRCGRAVVVPAAEWIEWREVSTPTKFRRIRGKYRLDPLSELDDELVVPFLHRACSRRCGPGGENSGWEFPPGCRGMTVGYCLYNGPPVAEE